MRKVLFVPVVAGLLIAALTACEPAKEGAVTTESPTTKAVAATSHTASAAKATKKATKPKKVEDFEAKMGTESVTYPDGLKVQVSVPVVKTIKSYGDTERLATFKVTLTNGSKKRIDATLTSMDIAVGKDGDAVDPEMMIEGNYGSGLADFKEIAPGRKSSVTYAVKVAKGQPIDVSIKPGFLDGYDDALFHGVAH